MQDRVCYFSKDDLSVGHELEMAEKRIQEEIRRNIKGRFFDSLR